jgi:hypothetical protein
MPFSRRSIPFGTLQLGAPLLAAFLLAPVGARAGNDDRDGRVAARELMEGVHDDARNRAKLFYGDQDSHDPVRDRGHRYDRVGNFEDPDKARRLVAEELLSGIEQRLNEGRWIPFRNKDRKTSGPQVLFGLEDPTPEPPVVGDSWRSRFRVSLVRGLEYRQEFATGERNRKLQMRVYGPVVPGGPGLGLQLRGHALERRFRLNAYGGTNEAGLTVDFEF